MLECGLRIKCKGRGRDWRDWYLIEGFCNGGAKTLTNDRVLLHLQLEKETWIIIWLVQRMNGVLD